MNKAFTKETEVEEALPEFVDALPKTGSGKIQRFRLREMERAR